MCRSRVRQCFSGCLLCILLVVAGSDLLFAQNQAASRSQGAIVVGGSDNPDSGNLVTVFKFTNFSDVSSLTFNGSARQAGFNLLLAPRSRDQVGSIWYDNQVNVGQGFVTSFTLEIVPSSTSQTTADGMAFVIQNAGLSALGDLTGEPGYEGILNSLAVEFDTFTNLQFSDPNNNHIAIQSCGTAGNSLDHASSCDLGVEANLPITLADGAPHKYVVHYVPGSGGGAGTFTVHVDGQLVLTSSLSLDTLLSLNGNDAWIGFTGGTGEDFEAQMVKNWVFANPGTALRDEP